MKTKKESVVTTNELVRVKKLAVRRGTFTLSVPEWSVEGGNVVGVVGPNGAGKTTLLESLAGLRPISGGVLEVFGHEPWKEPVRVRSHLGFMSDDMPVFPMRIEKLLHMVSGYYRTWNARLVVQLLARFDLDPTRKVQELSRGEGTRLRLILAMAFEPRLLVLDEPAAGLDLSGRRALLESVLDVTRDPERTVVVSSHQLADVERIADRLLVLKKGDVVGEGPTAELVKDTQTLEEALVTWGAA
jgi:ABC-2 type transport system ATP-binding protein